MPEILSSVLLEQRLGIVFKRRDLLDLALIHLSKTDAAVFSASKTIDEAAAPSNERLEFLGDAVLGAAAAAFLYKMYPEMDEGELTMLRSALVRRSIVARYADDLELVRFVPLSRAEEGPNGRGTMSVLSAAFEAVVGAVFLDQGFARSARFLDRFFRRYLPLVLEADLHRNPKSELQEFAQGLYRVTPTYKVLERSGPAHDSRFVAEAAVVGQASARGEGINRQQAEQDAARMLLGVLRASMATAPDAPQSDASS